MKTLAKVFIIIGMVLQFWMIVPLIFGFVTLKKMKTEKPSIVLSVLDIFFISPLAGLFLLLSKPEEYQNAD